jgi:hypothetical protein
MKANSEDRGTGNDCCASLRMTMMASRSVQMDFGELVCAVTV